MKAIFMIGAILSTMMTVREAQAWVDLNPRKVLVEYESRDHEIFSVQLEAESINVEDDAVVITEPSFSVMGGKRAYFEPEERTLDIICQIFNPKYKQVENADDFGALDRLFSKSIKVTGFLTKEGKFYVRDSYLNNGTNARVKTMKCVKEVDGLNF